MKAIFTDHINTLSRQLYQHTCCVSTSQSNYKISRSSNHTYLNMQLCHISQRICQMSKANMSNQRACNNCDEIIEI